MRPRRASNAGNLNFTADDDEPRFWKENFPKNYFSHIILDDWNGNFPFITGADVTELCVSNARSFLTEKGIDSGKTQKCEKGDLLIVSRTRVGRIGIAATTLGVSQDVSVLKMNESYDAKFLALFLKSISKRLEEACQGETIKGLTRGYIENISIPIPTFLPDQIAIASDLEHKMSELQKARRAAERQPEAIKMLPGAILREVFDFEDENTGS
jgi:restriction endonuclease S subunit